MIDLNYFFKCQSVLSLNFVIKEIIFFFKARVKMIRQIQEDLDRKRQQKAEDKKKQEQQATISDMEKQERLAFLK